MICVALSSRYFTRFCRPSHMSSTSFSLRSIGSRNCKFRLSRGLFASSTSPVSEISVYGCSLEGSGASISLLEQCPRRSLKVGVCSSLGKSGALSILEYSCEVVKPSSSFSSASAFSAQISAVVNDSLPGILAYPFAAVDPRNSNIVESSARLSKVPANVPAKQQSNIKRISANSAVCISFSDAFHVT